MATGLADHLDRDLHPRARDEPVLDSLFDAEIGAVGVADRGDAGFERGPEVPDRLEEPIGERRLGVSPEVDVAEENVGVAVEEAGHDRAAGYVDRLITVETRPEIDDPAIFDDEVALGGRSTGRGEQPAPAEDGSAHVSLLLIWCSALR